MCVSNKHTKQTHLRYGATCIPTMHLDDFSHELSPKLGPAFEFESRIIRQFLACASGTFHPH